MWQVGEGSGVDVEGVGGRRPGSGRRFWEERERRGSSSEGDSGGRAKGGSCRYGEEVGEDLMRVKRCGSVRAIF